MYNTCKTRDINSVHRQVYLIALVKPNLHLPLNKSEKSTWSFEWISKLLKYNNSIGTPRKYLLIFIVLPRLTERLDDISETR